MAELSKTAKAAKAAVERSQVKKKEVRSTEAILADLRNNRASGLHVSPTDVDVLFAEYDRITAAVKALYYAAIWHADRPVDELALWTAVRDAAGFSSGDSPKPIEDVQEREGKPTYDQLVTELKSVSEDRAQFFQNNEELKFQVTAFATRIADFETVVATLNAEREEAIKVIQELRAANTWMKATNEAHAKLIAELGAEVKDCHAFETRVATQLGILASTSNTEQAVPERPSDPEEMRRDCLAEEGLTPTPENTPALRFISHQVGYDVTKPVPVEMPCQEHVEEAHQNTSVEAGEDTGEKT
jgi:hypothetical protein